MKKKVFSMMLCVAMTVAGLSGCGEASSTVSEKEADSNKEAAADEITVGSVIMNTSGEWFAEVMQGMEAAGKELGVKVNIVSSDNEVSKESDNVSTFIAQGTDAIAICPLSADASAAAVDAAREAGIPVVAWNCTVNTDTDGFVGVSNYDLGKMTGEYVAQYVKDNYPDGCKLAILGNHSYEVGVERCNGFKDVIADVEGLEIVAEQDAEMQDEGMDITEQILTANPDVNIIWAWNQTSLLGCSAYMQNIGNKDIVVMGTDMSIEIAKTMLGDDVTLQAVTTQMPYDIGYNAIANAVKAVKGETYEEKMLIDLKTYVKDDVAEIEKYVEDHKSLVE
ncbi:substrate-binding domain-containing protein [Anaerobium acetethylicum]|uniref:Simple sugar transport system substrate-binding protein/ribose transport system substrate-binding protein n=1 Tax=Anaerobium acetethylicum TaxID=1619234 RepID=A0A1D3TYT8_9FIRM|nr:substrate-binding domain-containing protein [Anaerobium acetethylicum]SCP99653.1 simple sugar transport system substrate-binding protein/ribose transport system substrate-binding protein [Anaerobium acetethylicum]